MNKPMSKDVISVLRSVIRELTEDGELQGVDKVIIVLYKPTGKEGEGLLTTYTNATDQEVMFMCDVVIDIMDKRIEHSALN